MALLSNLRSSPGTPGIQTQRRLITDLITIVATAADTGDAMTMLEIETPSGGGCPPHTQRHEDEAIYVLAGTYTVLIGDRELVVEAGDSVFVPRGTVHGFANPGPETARMLVVLTPGGIHERFIDEIGDAADRPAWQADMAHIVAVAPKYGIEFLSPDDIGHA